MNILALVRLAFATAGKAPIMQTEQDIELLVGLVTKIKAAGKVDLKAMQASGTLLPAVTAMKRTSSLLESLLQDKTQTDGVAALIEVLPS